MTPLLDAVPTTDLGIALSLSEKYTGHTVHANCPGAHFERVLGFDTRARGTGITVADVVGSTTFGYTRTWPWR